MAENPLTEKTLAEIIDNCTPEEVRDLALAALEAYGQNTVELDDVVDARTAMEDALRGALPQRIHDACNAITRNTPEAAYYYEVDTPVLNLWRGLMDMARVNEQNSEMARRVVSAGDGDAVLGIVDGAWTTLHGKPRSCPTVCDWETGKVLGWAAPDPAHEDEGRYVSILCPPEAVVLADYDHDEATTDFNAIDAARNHPAEDFFHGTYPQVLANIYTEHRERYV